MKSDKLNDLLLWFSGVFVMMNVTREKNKKENSSTGSLKWVIHLFMAVFKKKKTCMFMLTLV